MNGIKKETRASRNKNNQSATNAVALRTAGAREEEPQAAGQLSTGMRFHELNFTQERDYAHWGLNE